MLKSGGQTQAMPVTVCIAVIAERSAHNAVDPTSWRWTMKCCICNIEIQKNLLNGWTSGNNAEPVKSGRCCDDCNAIAVIPVRMQRLRMRNEVIDA